MEDARPAMESAGRDAQALKDWFLAAVDRDTDAFNAIVAAFRLPQGNAEEKAARTAAEARVRRFELQLEDQNREIGERIARDRDEAINAVNTEAEEESKRLDAIDGTRVTTLARYVVDLVVGRSETGGPR